MKVNNNVKRSIQIVKKQKIIEEDSGAESEIEEEIPKNDGTMISINVKKNDVDFSTKSKKELEKVIEEPPSPRVFKKP